MPMRVDAEASADTKAGDPPPQVVMRTLENGMQVVVAPSTGSARAWIAVVYQVGTRDEPQGYRGLAHLTEHIAFRGGEVLAAYEDLGATGLNGTTSSDETVYYARLPIAALERAIWLESTRMAFLLEGIEKREVAHERTIVTHEWRQNVHSTGLGLSDLVSKELFPEGHPYRLRGDDPDDIAAIELPHVQWFAQRNYLPARATLVVTGAPDAAKVFAWATKYFGRVRASADAAPRPEIAPLERLAQRCRVRVGAASIDAVLSMTWRAPPHDSPDAAVLDVISVILSHPRNGRLTRALSLATGSASGVAAVLHELELASLFSIAVAARASEETAPMLAHIDHALHDLAEGNIDDSELASARKYAAERAVDSTGSLAYALSLGRGERDVSQRPRDAYHRIQIADVKRVAAHWLDPKRRVEVDVERHNRGRDRIHCDAAEGP